jgi:hypothetical protein
MVAERLPEDRGFGVRHVHVAVGDYFVPSNLSRSVVRCVANYNVARDVEVGGVHFNSLNTLCDVHPIHCGNDVPEDWRLIQSRRCPLHFSCSFIAILNMLSAGID